MTPTGEKNFPIFRNEGKFTIIDAGSVESGTFYVDTRPVQQYPDPNSLEWESHFKLNKDGTIINPDDIENVDIPRVYKPEGEVYRLWEVSSDLTGQKAKTVHEKILELIKHNVPAKEIDEQILGLINDLNQSITDGLKLLS